MKINKKTYFPKRIPEPKEMGELEIEEFEKLAKEKYAQWTIPLLDHLIKKGKINYKAKMKILDVACGPGILTKALGEKFKNSLVIGLDLNKVAIRLAKRNSQKLKNVSFVEGNAEKLPFSNEEFDIVVCKDSIHHFKNPIKVIEELIRVTKKGGVVYIQDLRRDVPFEILKTVIPPDDLRKKLIYYSVRASYTIDEIKNILKKLNISKYFIGIRKVISKYKKIGIDLKSLRYTFRSRFFVIIFKK